MKAIIIGATGLVGSELTRILKDTDYYSNVIAYGRKLDSIKDLTNNILSVQKFEDIDSLALDNIDHVYCCIGTTIKKAKSKEVFRSVDFDIPVQLATKCHSKQIKKLIIVSALGADSTSKVFYNRTKGEMEREVKKHFSNTCFVRPSLLLGERDEQRIAEGIGQYLMPLLNPLLQGSLKKFRAIDGKDVARALYEVARYGKTNIDIEVIS